MVNSHNIGISTGLSISGSSEEAGGSDMFQYNINSMLFFFVECDIGMGHTDLPKSLALKGDC